MNTENIIADPIHFSNDENYTIIKSIKQRQIHIVKENDTLQLFYLIKKSEKYILTTKNSFINYLEKSFELIHPSVINLSSYSIEKPYLYYKYLQEPQNIDNILLSDENIQKICIGIASGLSYLISKGYYFDDFSFDYVIFDSQCYPKLIDYIDLENIKKCSEKDMIIKYADILQKIFMKKTMKDSKVFINAKLKKLIERCQQNTNVPTFYDFINFFISNPFGANDEYIHSNSYQEYLIILQLQDRVTFDFSLSNKVIDDNKFDSIDQIYYYFYKNREIKELNSHHLFLLNSLPDYYIKSLAKIMPSLSDKLIRYLYYEDISLIIPDWQKIYNFHSKNKPFEIYKMLMNKIKSFEKDKINCSIKEKNILDFKIDALRNQAIMLLKKAAKQSNDAKINIELAVQYIKNDILPYNLPKSLSILDNISNADKQTKILIEQMKEKIRSYIKSTSKEVIIQNIQKDQGLILQKAELGDILSLLYVGFAFYTGFNGFTIFFF